MTHRRQPHVGEQLVPERQALQADGELDIRGAHDVLHLELLEGRREPELLHDLGVLQAGSEGGEVCVRKHVLRSFFIAPERQQRVPVSPA